MADITLDRVRKQYGSVTIIDDLSLKVQHGEFFTLLGPSGCGKTTLLRMIAGFIQPTAGRVLIGDEDVTHLPAHKRETGMVFQDYALFPDKTVFDNVAYGLRVRRVSRQQIEERVARILDRVELGHLPKRYPGELSGGQRQRVALARALVIEPRILLMDEPLSNLDAKLRIQMRDVIRELQQELQITTVFVTHDQEEALSMSDRIALLKGGRIDQLDVPEVLYGEPLSAYAADFIGAANLINIQTIESDGDACRVTIPGGTVRVSGPFRQDKVCLAVRPEHVRMTSGNDDQLAADAGSVAATVVFRRYLGFKVTYCLRLADGSTINADLPASQDPRCESGRDVQVSFGGSARLVTAMEQSA
ncbi:ABC transporter ATP-binding protein [Orrella marina]|uniref:ABC transporter ATP-binding protein n=1 Tax=Orrella marina TaxID=2163011 RepID=A0A2R4XNJ5_9BURK|nr:ABC transporter ATP-binding protein [Orrella marina]AWB35338.1 ABC transporter ATP-binding protein [Orrella marina]